MIYFGTDREAALTRWLEEKDALLNGRAPRKRQERPTLRELANRFLDAKRSLVESGDLSRRTWSDYYDTCQDLIEAFGKERPILELESADFEKLHVRYSKRFGAVALGIAIQRTRTVFKFAFDEELIDRPSGSARSSRSHIGSACYRLATKPGQSSSRRQNSECSSMGQWCQAVKTAPHW